MLVDRPTKVKEKNFGEKICVCRIWSQIGDFWAIC